MAGAQATTRTLNCPTCNIEIGRYVIYKDKVYILHGSILARQFIHNCAVDGRSFYWHGRSEDEKIGSELVITRGLS